ncbi:MAG: PIN domain-containing protein [Candidatus Diapherotrites archaeon]
MRLYLDSNVLISFLRTEVDKAFNLRFNDSARFFSICREQSIEVVISRLFLQEVEKVISLSEKNVLDVLNSEGLKIVKVEMALRKTTLNISGCAGIHYLDAAHIASALESNSNAIVTWNKKDFEKAKRLIPCISPDEFI